MSDVERIKSGIFKTLESIDKDKLSLCDLKTYAEILKITCEAQDKSYFDSIMEKFNKLANNNPTPKTVSEMR